jgi:hypothetical protein
MREAPSETGPQSWLIAAQIGFTHSWLRKLPRRSRSSHGQDLHSTSGQEVFRTVTVVDGRITALGDPLSSIQLMASKV